MRTDTSRGRELWCLRELRDVCTRILECGVLECNQNLVVSPLTACSADMEFIDGEHFIDDESRRWLDAQNK